MNSYFPVFYSIFLLAMVGCQVDTGTTQKIFESLKNEVYEEGKSEYLNSPYVTAGNRLYAVGHQNGSFPDLGWHITGEMGGIWNHPIKLMDGFYAEIYSENGKNSQCLDNAVKFVNYPYASKLFFDLQPSLPLLVERTQFVPDDQEGIVISYSISNKSKKAGIYHFSFTGLVDLRPVWLGERTGMNDDQDTLTWDDNTQSVLGKDASNEWYVVFGGNQSNAEFKEGLATCAPKMLGKGASATLKYQISIPAGASIILDFVIAGSYQSKQKAIDTYQAISDNKKKLVTQKAKRYADMQKFASLDIPDQDILKAYQWTKYNTDWLVRDVAGMGKGLSAGIPDFPWWFGCDNTYALQGVIAMGNHTLAVETMSLLQQLSEKVNPDKRVMHEASTNGAVFNKGNVNETPHFASLVWEAYCWTGDELLLESQYPFVKSGMQWLIEKADKDQNMYPDGFGMMEIHGLDNEMIDVVSYTCKGLFDAAKIANAMEDEQQANIFTKQAEALKEKINSDWWVDDENSYADFIGTKEKAIELLEGALIRADTLDKTWSTKELLALKAKMEAYDEGIKKGYVLYHNWVVNTPMETGIADEEKALTALESAKEYVHPFGVYVTGIDRKSDEQEGLNSFMNEKKGEFFNYTGAVMTLPTGVQAVASSRYGRVEEAHEYIKRMVASFSFAHPGSMYEVSPDYGMLVQAWNVYGLAVPIIKYFFGIQPRAYDQRIEIAPNMPKHWENVGIDNVLIADNSISIKKRSKNKQVTYSITQKIPEWELLFTPQDFRDIKGITINGGSQAVNDNLFPLKLRGADNEIQIEFL